MCFSSIRCIYVLVSSLFRRQRGGLSNAIEFKWQLSPLDRLAHQFSLLLWRVLQVFKTIPLFNSDTLKVAQVSERYLIRAISLLNFQFLVICNLVALLDVLKSLACIIVSLEEVMKRTIVE